MLRILSTYLFVSKKLTPELLQQISSAGFQAIEIFATRSHFDYATRQEVRAIAQALSDQRLQLASLHAPTSRDLSINREGGTPLSICEVERTRRIEAPRRFPCPRRPTAATCSPASAAFSNRRRSR